jgi:DNA-directed RNA polymerase sigma subunit (sigma70/sigma32)
MADTSFANLGATPLEQASPPPSKDALRCLEILTADQHRLGGALHPERADSLFEKRSLSTADRSWVYSQLGIGTPDNTDDSPEKDGDDDEGPEEEQEAPSALADPVDYLLNATKHSRLLNADEEKTLGRLILNANRLKSALSTGNIAQDAQIRAAIRRGEDAHSKLVLANLRLVVRIAYDFKWRTSIELSDLVQDGIIGLMRAVDGFDPELGHRFSTYASYWIRQSIGRAIQNTSRMIRIGPLVR